MLTMAYLESSQTSMMELFSLRLSHILKVVNSIKLPLGSIFLHNSPFQEKTYNSENFGRKSLLLTMEHFFKNSKLHYGMVLSIKKVL